MALPIRNTGADFPIGILRWMQLGAPAERCDGGGEIPFNLGNETHQRIRHSRGTYCHLLE